MNRMNTHEHQIQVTRQILYCGYTDEETFEQWCQRKALVALTFSIRAPCSRFVDKGFIVLIELKRSVPTKAMRESEECFYPHWHPIGRWHGR